MQNIIVKVKVRFKLIFWLKYHWLKLLHLVNGQKAVAYAEAFMADVRNDFDKYAKIHVPK